jgi:polysaccharide pyruvyl transferase WcaK-like protein
MRSGSYATWSSKMKKLRILHIASFSGNIGDNFNHMGFVPWFEEFFDAPVEWTRLEIREFYWKERRWDESFVELANTHDLVVVGGGNYFELWVESSPTGTSIAIDPATFSKIKTPVFFNALGVDPGQGVPESSRQRFTKFLNQLLDSTQFIVSVRNDGAAANLRRHIGEKFADAVQVVPDHGFFALNSEFSKLEIFPRKNGTRRIAINIANDMPEIRFSNFRSQDDFLQEMAGALTAVAHEDSSVELLFVPHIFRDVEFIAKILGHLEDRLRRTRVAIAPFGSGDVAARVAMQHYLNSELTLGMRFHASVCPIGMGCETLGLACYPQIRSLYEELGEPDRCVELGRPGFSEELKNQILRGLNRPFEFSSSPVAAIERVQRQRENFSRKLRDWLAANELTHRLSDR